MDRPGTVVPLAPREEAVLLVAFPPADAQRTAQALRAGGVLARPVAGPDEATALLDRRGIGVVCLGSGLSGLDALAFLRRLTAEEPEAERRHLVLAAGAEPAIFQELVDEDRIYYLSRRPPAPADLVALLLAAVAESRRRSVGAEGGGSDEAVGAPPAPEAARRLSRELARETDPRRAAAALARAARAEVVAGRLFAVLAEPESQTFAELDEAGAEVSHESLAAGLVGFVLRTGTTLRVDRLEEDPRADPEADGRGGPPGQRLLAAALPAGEDGSGPAWGALVALRGPTEPPFSAADAGGLERLAAQAAPFATLFAPPAGGRGALYRPEALAHHTRPVGIAGNPLELSPDWTRWTFRLLAGVAAAGLALAIFGSLPEVASGVAVVQLEGATGVTARLAGTVAEVAVAAGERVERDQPLLRLDPTGEADDLARVEREFELALLQRLRDPGDRGSESLLHGLRAERDRARARLAQRTVRAPSAGVVGDLRVRPGQAVGPGDILLSLTGEAPARRLVAVLPGRHRPRLRPGMELRLEVEGYPHAYQELTVERVDDAAVGPAEARRVLGAEIADAVPLAAGVVLVYARLPSATFSASGRSYPYHAGLQGRAEVRLGSRRLLAALLPGVAGTWEGGGE